MSADYIVQVQWRIYYADLKNGVIYETPYPSAAMHLEYDVADQICQRIRARGHLDAVVCDARGNPVIAYDLEKAKPISEEEIRQFYDEQITESEEAAL
jgi:hypothetical protein